MTILGFLCCACVGLCVGFGVARHRYSRGDKGGAYRPVSENEVRSLIREYVDTEGVSDTEGKEKAGLYSETP